MKISVTSMPLNGLMFGKGFIRGVQASRHLHQVNVANGMPIVRVRKPVIDRIRKRPSRKFGFGQK